MLNSCMVNAKVDGLIVVLVMVHGVESWHVCVLACLCIWRLRGSFCLAVYNHYVSPSSSKYTTQLLLGRRPYKNATRASRLVGVSTTGRPPHLLQSVYFVSTNRRPMQGQACGKSGASWPAAVSTTPLPCILLTMSLPPPHT